MRRLVYAPKAWVFIRSENLGGMIFNVTNDVVSGEVTRNVNDLSTASVVLRNRFFKWLFYKSTASDPDNGKQIFLPMDMITIFLQRIGGKPIQVFTGYLDSVPMYQLYPGNCTLKASCTLKRLAYTWFDPGLTFFQQFVTSQGNGWFIDPTTGAASSPQTLFAGTTDQDPNNPIAGSGLDLTDGGFAKLLYQFMIEIANWQPDDVIISRLPQNLAKQAVKLYIGIEDAVEASEAQLEQAMAIMMGVNPTFNQPSSTGQFTSTVLAEANQVYKTCGQYSIPPIVAFAAALTLTNFNTGYASGPTTGAKFGYGLYAMQPKQNSNPVSSSLFSTANVLTGAEGYEDTIDGTGINDIIGDPVLATQVFCKRLVTVEAANAPGTLESFVGAANSNQTSTQQKAVQSWIEKALGVTLNQTTFSQIYPNAVMLAKNAASPTAATSTSQPGTSPQTVTWSNLTSFVTLNSNDQNALRNYINSPDALAAVLYAAKQVDSSLTLTVDPTLTGPKNPNVIYIGSSNQSAVSKLFTFLKGDSQIQSVYWYDGTGVQVLNNGQAGTPSSSLIKTHPPQSMVEIYTTNAPSTTATTSSTSTTENGTVSASTLGPNSPFSFSDLAAFSADAAFAAQFSFPSSAFESNLLTGQRALLNDTSCLDAVKQFCQASMRNFMSLPDGRFIAFYPDYFGAHGRQPYWWIHDIEIVNMGIQLNDEALATHVYVVDDMYASSGSSLGSALDEITTRGVATLEQAQILTGFLDPNGNPNDPLGHFNTALDFIAHYGARPHKEDQPLIRNAIFEFLLAWQRFMQLWAGQFQTDVQFTFQPEVMAGGIIGFPEHNLQMYVESVTHTWDYTSGFDTNAVLSSPAEFTPDPNHKRPGFALAGNVNTIAGGNLG